MSCFVHGIPCGLQLWLMDPHVTSYILQFEVLRECMTANPAVFGEMLKDIDQPAEQNKQSNESNDAKAEQTKSE